MQLTSFLDRWGFNFLWRLLRFIKSMPLHHHNFIYLLPVFIKYFGCIFEIERYYIIKCLDFWLCPSLSICGIGAFCILYALLINLWLVECIFCAIFIILIKFVESSWPWILGRNRSIMIHKISRLFKIHWSQVDTVTWK
jgi:hypothetical protein